MLVDIGLSIGITMALSTLSYLLGMKFNYHKMQSKLQKEHIKDLEDNYNRLRAKHSKLTRDYENPTINVAEGSTLTESIHALINVLPPKWRKIALDFEPSIMKEINSNPENEQKIRTAIKNFTRKSIGEGEEQVERITI